MSNANILKNRNASPCRTTTKSKNQTLQMTQHASPRGAPRQHSFFLHKPACPLQHLCHLHRCPKQVLVSPWTLPLPESLPSINHQVLLILPKAPDPSLRLMALLGWRTLLSHPTAVTCPPPSTLPPRTSLPVQTLAGSLTSSLCTLPVSLQSLGEEEEV